MDIKHLATEALEKTVQVLPEGNQLRKDMIREILSRQKKGIQKPNESLIKGGPGSGRKPEFKSSYGDGVYSKKENAISAGKHLVKPHNYTMIEHDGKHIVTTNARASNFIKEYGSKRVGKFFSNGNFVHEGHNPLEAMKHDGIEKGGEGSKGGKIIGHTSSGHAIYSHEKASSDQYKHFDKRDHQSAANVHRDLANKLKDRTNLKTEEAYGKNKAQVRHHHQMASLHDQIGYVHKAISLGDYHTEDAKTNPYLVKSFVGGVPTQDKIRKELDEKLSKGLIDNDLHSKAIAQLDFLIKGAEGSRGGKSNWSHK